MWAVIATVFVNRRSCEESLSAAVSRTAATLVSFAYCLVYLALLPFHVGALPVLQPISRFADTLVGVAVGVGAA
jgi:hypothetical protein